MDDYLAALDNRLAELNAEIEAVRAKYKDDETPAEQPPLPDSPND